MSDRLRQPQPAFVSAVACTRPNSITSKRQNSIHVCRGPSCTSNGGGEKLIVTFQTLVPTVRIMECGCLGKCGEYSNVLLNNSKIVRASEALKTLNIPPEPKAKQSLDHKKLGDIEMANNHPELAEKYYNLSLECLPDFAPALVRARILSNLALAQFERELWNESLTSARLALSFHAIDSALLRVAQNCHVLKGDSLLTERDRVVEQMKIGTKDKFLKWKREWDRKQLWNSWFGKK